MCEFMIWYSNVCSIKANMDEIVENNGILAV